MTEQGKINATAPDAEMLVIGALMADNHIYDRLVSLVGEDDFSDQALAVIWREAASMIKGGRPATWHTVAQTIEQLDGRDGANWKDYCQALQAAGQPIYAEHHAQIVRTMADLRQIAQVCSEGTTEALSDPSRQPAEIAAGIAGDLQRIGQGIADWEDAGDVGERALKDLEKAQTVYETGLPSLDQRMMGGLHPGKFYGLAARHKAGKSMTLATMAYNIMYSKTPCGMVYLSLEMSPEEIWRRMAARRMNVNEARLAMAARRNDLRMLEEAYNVNHQFRDAGLYFLGKPGCTLDQLRTIIARAGMSDRVQGVFVDYIQLLQGQLRGQNRAEFLDDAAQMLASMSRKYGLWIVAAAQLNQEGNVRGSEGLLNACDMALFQHKVEQDGDARAWLEMRASRYTPAKDIGSELAPPLLMDFSVGPHFREIET